METLDEIAIKYGTDKSSKGHSYTQYYEMMFGPLRDNSLALMEIGVWEGASLKLWRDYFPLATIYGLDIDDKTQYDEGRVKTFICDQTDRDQIISWCNTTPQMDIIIDDGIHTGQAQWLSFCYFFHHLKVGGLYVIEDLLCAYDSRWNNPVMFLDMVKDMVDHVMMNGSIPNDHICANKQEAVQKYSTDYLSQHIEWIFVACGIVFIKKM